MTTPNKNKPGFGGQWVQIMRAGKHRDDRDVTRTIDAAFLDSVVSNFNVEEHEPPAVVGHPATDAPAYGYVSELRRDGDSLEARFADTDADFEALVYAGKFKKRSAAFYLDKDKAPGRRAPSLRHVGFLGAQPPAVKGLRNIQFRENEGEVLEINFSEGATMNEDDKKAAQEEIRKTAREIVTEFLKKTFGGGEPKPAEAVAFSEADQQRLIEAAVTKATAQFSETLKERDTKIEQLETEVARQSGSSTRASIVQFCESNLATVIPAFRNMGLVEFMESLDDSTASSKVTVISFAEKDGQEVEVAKEISQLQFFKNFITSLPQFIQFGETFGGLRITGDGSAIVDSKQLDALRAGMGVKPVAAK